MADVPIAINDVIRMVYFQDSSAQTLMTVLHLRCKVAPTTGTSSAQALTNLATKFSLAAHPLVAAWLPLIGNDTTLLKVRAQRVYPIRSVYQEEFMALEGTGLPALTPNTAVSIEKRTLLPGRHGVGRIQMGGIPNDQYVQGVILAGYQTALRTCWENLLGDQTVAADSSTYRFCLWSGLAVTGDTDLYDVSPQRTVRTMHRRTVGLGI